MSVFDDDDGQTMRVLGLGALGFAALTIALIVLAMIITA